MVVQGGPGKPRLVGGGANDTHGYRRSNADKRKVASTLSCGVSLRPFIPS